MLLFPRQFGPAPYKTLPLFPSTLHLHFTFIADRSPSWTSAAVDGSPKFHYNRDLLVYQVSKLIRLSEKMVKDSSFLFAGIRFDRKKFPKDFERFKEKKEPVDPEETPTFIDSPPEPIADEGKRSVKKRKRKAPTAESVDGISVFKRSESVAKDDQDEDEEDDFLEKSKEVFRQIERDAIMRKKRNIHVSGNNVPSPLESFKELRTRYKCKDYLLQNFGRECFACAPTGSGKTLAFVTPMLMKLKHALKAGVRAVILCPTRELASQTTRECRKLAEGKKFYIRLMTKQLVKGADFSKLRCDIIISTPLRLAFAIRKRKFDLSSATLPDTVEDLARTIMHDAVRVIIGRKNTATDSVKQKLVFAGSETGKLLALRQSRSGRAGRTGEAITLYTEDDIPCLRNIANVMVQSGFEVPSWIMSLRKTKWKKHRPKRESIATVTED
ncbi:DEAD-box ATP-dependent RNA helicase 57-like protein [Drosera capensis]